MAKPRSRFARKEEQPGAGSIGTCRRPWASPRRYHAFAASFGRFFPAAAETSRNPSSGAALVEDRFRHARKQYIPFIVTPKELIGLQYCASTNRGHWTAGRRSSDGCKEYENSHRKQPPVSAPHSRDGCLPRWQSDSGSHRHLLGISGERVLPHAGPNTGAHRRSI